MTDGFGFGVTQLNYLTVAGACVHVLRVGMFYFAADNVALYSHWAIGAIILQMDCGLIIPS